MKIKNQEVSQHNWVQKKSISKHLKTLFIFVVLVCSFQAKSYCQAISDESVVLQKCIDLASVQVYYPKNTNGSYQQVRILQYPFTFASDIEVTKFGQPVLFINRDLISGLDAYLNFTSFSINGNSASVSFNITYDRNTVNPDAVVVKVNLEKVDGNWNIINSNLN